MKLNVPEDEIAQFCRKWGVTEFALFGSILRDDFRPDSDVDVLLAFPRESGITLFDLVDMQDELEAAFGRPVDVVSRRAVELSDNPIRRRSILNSARVVYAAS